jgi:hypothetical protein
MILGEFREGQVIVTHLCLDLTGRGEILERLDPRPDCCLLQHKERQNLIKYRRQKHMVHRKNGQKIPLNNPFRLP